MAALLSHCLLVSSTSSSILSGVSTGLGWAWSDTNSNLEGSNVSTGLGWAWSDTNSNLELSNVSTCLVWSWYL